MGKFWKPRYIKKTGDVGRNGNCSGISVTLQTPGKFPTLGKLAGMRGVTKIPEAGQNLKVGSYRIVGHVGETEYVEWNQAFAEFPHIVEGYDI